MGRTSLIAIPRNIEMVGARPDGSPKAWLSWTAKYGAVGANGLNLPILVDGVNERGLAGGLLYIPGLVQFQNVSQRDAKTSLASSELLI